MSVYSSGRGFWANSCFFLRCASVGKIDTNQLTFVPFISMSVGGFFLFPPSLLSPTPPLYLLYLLFFSLCISCFEFIARLTAFTSQILTLTTFCA